MKRTPPRWFWGGEEFYALRSGAKGAVHFLPASLARLWKTQRVPAASLPRLLHDLEPSLKKSDHQPRLSTPTGRKVMLIVLAFIALACVGFFQPEGASSWKILVPVCG
jgi:hypothetical protein